MPKLLVVPENEMWVIWRQDLDHWEARGRLGCYGLAKTEGEAIKIAEDACVTTGRMDRIVVHRRSGRADRVIHRDEMTAKPSSQAFQDDVP